MASTERVCPFCGEPPGPGLFCAACGRNLAAVERLPTRAEWAAGAATREGAAASDATLRGPSADAPEPAGTLAERCARATAAFLEAMHAAGCPGTTRTPMPDAREGLFRRTPEAHGWVVRPVEWDDRDAPRHHEPGLVLTTEGVFHRLDSQIRGWGQRDFPQFHDTARGAPVAMPVEERLIAELDAVLRENGVGGAPAA